MVDLDILTDAEREALSEVLLAPQAAPGRVLVVDDDADSRELLAEIFTLHGIPCLVADNAQAGFDLLMTNRAVSLLVTDLRLGAESGLDLIRQVRESERAALPIIVVSGNAGVKDAIEAMHLSVVDFLLKPIDVDQLITLVRRELDL
ncbi:response regulator [Pseudomonas typographi]|uniref:Response regulator n=1 Tax=Pseudomonas typographi TaxID=2715964 RepID=A0ABR7YVI2_9PSED|nr:response regulator [Pseudomonas typographi]MBD1552191.1 response regulator [Pseudomonas typographi]MBD1597210.1 response regulator [Pseudomonas typographi]